MAQRRRPIKGIARFRRLLRRMPDTTRAELVAELDTTGRRILQAIIARSPRLSGKLRAGLSHKVLPTSLKLQIGLIGTPTGRAKLFYGRIQDLGREAKIVDVAGKRHRTQKTLSTGEIVTLMQRRKRVGDQYRRGRGALNAGQLRKVGDPYKMKVPAMAGKRFVTGSYPELRTELRANLQGIFTRGLRKVGGGDE